MDEIPELMQKAIEWEIPVLGCCFHVGSQMQSSEIHVQAITSCALLYKKVKSLFGIELQVLDIGGGFPTQYHDRDISIEEYCAPIKTALDTYFPNTEIWSEPGRYLTANAGMSVCKIIGKKIKQDTIWYFLDDGIYGLYSANLFDHGQYIPKPLIKLTGPLKKSIFCGPTCDSIDIFQSESFLPEMEIGDLMINTNMGAYTWASRTRFNHCHPVKWMDVYFEFAGIFNLNEAFEKNQSSLPCLN